MSLVVVYTDSRVLASMSKFAIAAKYVCMNHLPPPSSEVNKFLGDWMSFANVRRLGFSENKNWVRASLHFTEFASHNQYRRLHFPVPEYATFNLPPQSLRVKESNCLGCEEQIVAPKSSSMQNVIIVVGFFFFCRRTRESFCHSFWTEPLLDIFTQGMVK